MSRLLAIPFLVFCLATQANSAPLPAAEQALVRYIDAHQADSIALLEQAVNINSGTMNFAGVQEVSVLFDERLRALGFSTQWIDGAAFGRAGHLIERRPGTGPKILLIGHLDTVFEKDSPAQRFERIDANTAHGPGIVDMKGGIVVALLALQALDSIHRLGNLDVTFVMTGDEESAGQPLQLARAALLDAANDRQVAIGLENAADNPHTAVTARRSSSTWELRISGKTSHSSLIFSETAGYGAAYEMARVLEGWRAGLAGERYLTFSPGVVLAGNAVEIGAEGARGTASGKSNVTAQTAIATGDLRALAIPQREKAQRRMKIIASKSLPRTHTELTFKDSYPPMSASVGNSRLLQLYSESSEALGFGPVSDVDPQKAGAADISFVADRVGMAIDGVGLLGGNAHTVNEFADLRNLRSQSQRLAVLLLRLAQQPSLSQTAPK